MSIKELDRGELVAVTALVALLADFLILTDSARRSKESGAGRKPPGVL